MAATKRLSLLTFSLDDERRGRLGCRTRRNWIRCGQQLASTCQRQLVSTVFFLAVEDNSIASNLFTQNDRNLFHLEAKSVTKGDKRGECGGRMKLAGKKTAGDL